MVGSAPRIMDLIPLGFMYVIGKLYQVSKGFGFGCKLHECVLSTLLESGARRLCPFMLGLDFLALCVGRWPINYG